MTCKIAVVHERLDAYHRDDRSLTLSDVDTQDNKTDQVPGVSTAWRDPHSPRWSIPRKASRPPQAPRPRYPPSYRPIQDQRRASSKGERKICDRYTNESRHQRRRYFGPGQSVQPRVLCEREEFEEREERGGVLQAGRETRGMCTFLPQREAGLTR